jgi:hypothetical protein
MIRMGVKKLKIGQEIGQNRPGSMDGVVRIILVF